MSKLWIFIGEATGMPLAVEKCDFQPTIHPYQGTWERVYRKNELDELAQLEAQIRGHQEAMRPLLEKWNKMGREMTLSKYE